LFVIDYFNSNFNDLGRTSPFYIVWKIRAEI